MNRRIFIVFFALIAVLDLFVLSVHQDFRWLSKPLIMLSLITYFVYRTRKESYGQSLKKVFLISLFFALFGDILLLNEELFHLGLLSFLLMQAGYCICFFRQKAMFSRHQYILTAVLGLVVIVVLYHIWPYAGVMRIPVIVYSMTIAIMAILASSRDKDLDGYWLVLVGSLFFVVSDLIIGLNTFIPNLKLHGIWVMTTYSLAQFLIVDGYASSYR